MMKKINKIGLLLLILCLFSCSLGACKKDKPKDSDDINGSGETLPEQSKAFVDAVNKIVITFDSRDEIEAAFEMFENLDDDSWEYDEVLDAYAKLEDLSEYYYALLNYDTMANNFISKVEAIPFNLTLAQEYLVKQARNVYNSMSENNRLMLGVETAYKRLVEYETVIQELLNQTNIEENKQMALNFINECMKLKDSELITLEDKELIEACLKAYDELADVVKTLDNVNASYEKLQACKDRYDYLVLHPEIEDEIKISQLLGYLDELSMPVTLDDIMMIKNAEKTYRNFRDELKSNPEVVTAYAKLVKARKAYNTLYLEKIANDKQEALMKECNDFVEAVNLIPETITKEDGQKIYVALALYRDLSNDAKENSEVSEAYEKLVGYKAIFDTFELQQLTVKLLNILYSASIKNPNVVLQGAGKLLYPSLQEIYQVDKRELLASKCDLVLLVYSASNVTEPLFEVVINKTMNAGSEDIASNVMLSYLENASINNQLVVSGLYKLGLRIDDKTGQFKNSDVKMSAVTFNFEFTSRYQDNNDSTDVVSIKTAEEFLAIANNLNGNYVLANDIDLSAKEWKNLGEFSGTLDGNGYTISGLNCSKGPKDAFGIFLEILPGGIVRNLKVTGNVANAGTYAGLIAVRNRGQINNCYIDVKMISLGMTDENGGNSGDACIGGIVAENFGSISNVIVMSYIKGDGTQYGPLDGAFCVGNYGSLTNCYALATNIPNGAAIGNNNTVMLECLKTEAELCQIDLYAKFDRNVWEIVDGFIPELINYNA